MSVPHLCVCLGIVFVVLSSLLIGRACVRRAPLLAFATTAARAVVPAARCVIVVVSLGWTMRRAVCTVRAVCGAGGVRG